MLSRLIAGIVVFTTASSCILGCSLSRSKNFQTRDGIYVIDTDGKFSVRIAQENGRSLIVPVSEFSSFSPKRIEVFEADPMKQDCWVQIDGTAGIENWSEQPIIIIAAGKPYCELNKLGAITSNREKTSPLKAISFSVPNVGEANEVARALRKRFLLQSGADR